ncbi:MAG TPA: NUDIX domain-containing protein [Candidatus Saccharimonadales bacterium]|nr:NUDIX domain-containing protein [Candidatus Saccharimonadales bacterium]
MRKAVRAIVIKDDALLVMHRNKFGQEYYTLIGGGIDVNEAPEQALLREISEETSLEVKNPRLVFVEEAGDPYGTQYIYLCDYVSGEPVLMQDSIEAKIHADGKNLYKPLWLKLRYLPTTNFLSRRLKQAILEGVENGWPAEPVDITHKYQL